MKNYQKPEVEKIVFVTESIANGTGGVGGDMGTDSYDGNNPLD